MGLFLEARILPRIDVGRGSDFQKVDILNWPCITIRVAQQPVRILYMELKSCFSHDLVAILPSLMNSPIRSYPLRTPADSNIGVFVLGPRTGQKVALAGPHGAINQQAGIGGMPPIGAHAQVSAQNRNMEEMERRRLMEQQRARGQPIGPPHGQQAGRPRYKEEDEDEEESEHVSTRSLALTRYKRNHELMDEVFMYAAFGDRAAPAEQKPYAILDEMDIVSKLVR